MILSNCEVWFPQLDPARPSTRFSKTRPSWSIQIRTRDKAQKTEWEEAGLRVKVEIDEDDKPYYMANLSRKSIKANKDAATPPDVVDGNLADVDPRTIGNGSVANIRIFQYTPPQTDENSIKLASVLMGLQLVKHILYVPKAAAPREEFGQVVTEVVASEDEADGFQKVSEPKPGSDMDNENDTF